MVAEAVIAQERREFGNAPASLPSSQVSGVVNPDAYRGFIFPFVLIGNVTLGQPRIRQSPPIGTQMYLVLQQDGTGSRTVTWAACYRNAPDWSAGGAAGTIASGEFRWDGQSWQYVGGSSAFAAPGVSIFIGAGQIQFIPGNPTLLSNPAPSVGAVAASGVAPTVIRGTVTKITPTVGAAALGSAAVIQGAGISPPNSSGFSLAIVGNAPIRTP